MCRNVGEHIPMHTPSPPFPSPSHTNTTHQKTTNRRSSSWRRPPTGATGANPASSPPRPWSRRPSRRSRRPRYVYILYMCVLVVGRCACWFDFEEWGCWYWVTCPYTSRFRPRPSPHPQTTPPPQTHQHRATAPWATPRTTTPPRRRRAAAAGGAATAARRSCRASRLGISACRSKNLFLCAFYNKEVVASTLLRIITFITLKTENPCIEIERKRERKRE